MKRLVGWVGFALSLCAGVAWGEPAATTDVAIETIEFSETDEEGGFASWTYHPSGWMHFSGQKSCCGYRPPLEVGWYRIAPANLQALFDGVAKSVVLGHTEPPNAQNAGHTTVVLGDGRRLVLTKLAVRGAVTDLRHPTKPQPKDWNRRKYVGHYLAVAPTAD